MKLLLVLLVLVAVYVWRHRLSKKPLVVSEPTPVVTKKERGMRVYIDRWQNSRRTYIEDGFLFLEVALESHCGTCERRIRFIESTLRSNSTVTWNWVHSSSCRYVKIALSGDTSSVRIAPYLERLLGVTVEAV